LDRAYQRAGKENQAAQRSKGKPGLAKNKRGRERQAWANRTSSWKRIVIVGGNAGTHRYQEGLAPTKPGPRIPWGQTGGKTCHAKKDNEQ